MAASNIGIIAEEAQTTSSPRIEVNGLGINPALIEPISLQINSSGVANVLTVRIHRAFDEQAGLNWINFITLRAVHNEDTKFEWGQVYFWGLFSNQEVNFSTADDSIIVSIPDVTWAADCDFIEFDYHGVTPGWAITAIMDGVIGTGELTGYSKVRRSHVGIAGGSNDSRTQTLYEIAPHAVRDLVDVATDLSVLGDRYQNFPMIGIPAFQAIIEIIRRSGNFLAWVTYDNNKAWLQIQERKTGPERNVIIGNFGTDDTGANVEAVSGSISQFNIANRWVGRGDKIEYEGSRYSPYGTPLSVTPDWDESLNTAYLAETHLGRLSKQYATVGKRYRISMSSMQAGGFVGALAIYTSKQKITPYRDRTGKMRTRTRSQAVQVFVNEPAIDATYRPFEGRFTIERIPPEKETVGGDKNNQDGDIAIVFRDAQVYKDRANDDGTWAGFRNFRMSFTVRVTEKNESRNFGRVSADSGVVGSHPITRSRLIRDSSFKYIWRRSDRVNLDANDGQTVTHSMAVARDDSKQLGELCRRLAKLNSVPTRAFRISLVGNKTPDFSWMPGQRITSLVNSDGFTKVDLDVVGVHHNFATMATTILTENIEAFREVIR